MSNTNRSNGEMNKTDFVDERRPHGAAARNCRLRGLEYPRRSHAYPWNLNTTTGRYPTTIITITDVIAVINVTHCKCSSLNLQINTGESRQTLKEYLVSISVRYRVLSPDFHSSSLRELSTKDSVDEHPRINPEREK